MSAKSISFKRPPATADEWVGQKPKLKRLTIDVPETLHRRIKAACAVRGETMNDALLRLVESGFPETRDPEDP